MLAEGMGATTFTPPRKPGDPEVEALTATFAYHDGIKVLHEGIQYLVERSKDEQQWLTALAGAPFPVTVIWGLYDTVSPPRVAGYVWNQYLMLKPGGNRLYFIPDANHYLQVDRPDAFVKVLLHALEPAADQGPGALEAELGAPPASRQLARTAARRSRRAPCTGSPRHELRTQRPRSASWPALDPGSACSASRQPTTPPTSSAPAYHSPAGPPSRNPPEQKFGTARRRQTRRTGCAAVA
jgi:hypothetical protein